MACGLMRLVQQILVDRSRPSREVMAHMVVHEQIGRGAVSQTDRAHAGECDEVAGALPAAL